VATGYCGIRFAGLGEDVGRGYAAALGVVLAYSALEACWTALDTAKPKVDEVALIDLELAARLRRALRGRFSLGTELNARLSKRVELFMAGADEPGWPTSQDVLTIARAIRHLFAHGVFTPSGGGTVTAVAARALQDLADVVLAYSVDVFRTEVRRRSVLGT
jgi:hypothetical protein